MGDPVGDADPILNETAPALDEPLQRTHRHALRAQRRELVTMSEQQLERDLGVRSIVLGMARRESAAVLSEHVRIDRKQNEEVVLGERRDDWAAGKLQRHGNASSPEALLESTGPSLDRGRTMFDDSALETLQPGHVEADVVLAICPIEPDEGSKDHRTESHSPMRSR